MKTNRKGFIILFVVGTLMFSCSPEKKEKQEVKEKEPEKVKVLELTNQTIANTIEYTSTLAAYEEVYLAPAQPGRIEKIYVEVGQKFNKGDLLVSMDETQLNQLRIQLKNLEIDLSRLDTLLKTKTIPQQKYDQLKAQYDVMKTNYDYLEKNVSLRAPFSGIVTGKFYQNGEMFSAAPNNQAGKAAVISIAQIQPLKAIVNVTERFYPQVKVGTKVKVVCDVFPEKEINASVMRVYPTIDPLSRTFQVELLVPNSDEQLRPGMFCRAIFELSEVEAILVPAIAVLKLQGSNERYVFIDNGGYAKRVSVQIGKRFDDKIQVISDELKVGTKLIVVGQARLVDGDKIQVVE